jgi:hypothetical protein
MRKGGSKAAPSPADLKAGVLAEGVPGIRRSNQAEALTTVRLCETALTY